MPSTMIKCLKVVKGSVEVHVVVAVEVEVEGEGEGDDINGHAACLSCGRFLVVAHVQTLQKSRGHFIAFLIDCISFPAFSDSGTVCVCVCVCV